MPVSIAGQFGAPWYGILIDDPIALVDVCATGVSHATNGLTANSGMLFVRDAFSFRPIDLSSTSTLRVSVV